MFGIPILLCAFFLPKENNRERFREIDIQTDSQIIKRAKYEVKLGEGFEYEQKPYICPNCHESNSNYANLCKNCHFIFPICSLCKRKIPEEENFYCPSCNHCFHRREFLEWYKIKATCPICETKVKLSDFISNLKKPFIECVACKQYIPKDSIFCVFCGESQHHYSKIDQPKLCR